MSNRRKPLPFPASARVKRFEAPAPAATVAPQAGRHYYHIPVLVQWPGHGLEAQGFEAWFRRPMDGHLYLDIVRKYESGEAGDLMPPAPSLFRRVLLALRLAKPLGRPAVVALAPMYLGFVPDPPAETKPEPPAEPGSKPNPAPEAS